MHPDLAVPDVSLLKRFLLGQLSGAESEAVESYLEQHPDFASTLADLAKADTLVDSLRGAAKQPLVDPPELVGLMEKLSQLRSARDDATVGMESGESIGDVSVLAPPQAPDEIGRLGGYRVLKLLGAGGMGMVYQAEDVQLQRPVALKVIKPEVAKNVSSRERFLREARAAAQIKSDHVVTIHQVGEDRGVVFLAMEFLEGMSLEDWLKKGRTPKLIQAARIGRHVALGLAAAHERGLIHRDIKPGNVWLESNHQGRAKLLDFGLARGDTDEVHLTQSGAIVGTPAYMAPEQARGEKVDARCDLFSLGVVLYRLCTGALPFRGDNTMSLLTSLALDTPKPPREINPALPPRLATLIERLLAKDREQRPKTAKAVADELGLIEREAAHPATDERTLRLEPQRIPAANLSERAVTTSRLRSRLGKYVAAAILLLLLGGVAAAIVIIIRDKQGKEVARVNVPDGGSVVIQDDGKANGEAKEKRDAKPATVIVEEPLEALRPGDPLSPTALVRQPAKLPGMRSWTIEPRRGWWSQQAAYRADGQRLAVACMDGTVRVWEPASGKLVQVLFAAKPVISLAWSPDGRTLASGAVGPDRQVSLWDAESGRLLRSLQASPDSSVHALHWSPDGKTLRAFGERTVFAWNVTDGKLLRQFTRHGGVPAFTRDGKLLAQFQVDAHSVCIHNTETGELHGKLSVGKDDVRGLAWSPDGTRLACAIVGEGVVVWEVAKAAEIARYKDLPGSFIGVAWSPDGRSLVLDMAFHYLMQVVEVAPGAKPRPIENSMGSALAWSPDGQTIARITPYGALLLLGVTPGVPARMLMEPIGGTGYAWSPEGPSLAAFDVNVLGPTFLSSVDNGQVFATLKDAAICAAWSPDGKMVATAGPDASVLLWERNGKLRATLSGHTPTWMAWSPDGKLLATSNRGEKRVLVWDVEKGERLRELGPFDSLTANVSWSPDGRLLAIEMQDPNVGWPIWDVAANKLANDPKQWKLRLLGGPCSLIFAPDSKAALVITVEDGRFRLRDLATLKQGPLLPPSAAPMWSPDGQLLAVPLANEARVELWTGDVRRRLRTLTATLANVAMAGFSRDGKLVAGFAGDRLHVWETDTGLLRGILLPHPVYNGLTVAPNGHYTGNEQVERGIVVVVQRDDGTQDVLEPADFEQKYGWKNDPGKVHLLQPLPPSPYSLPGQPMGSRALVREPAELADANATSWTIETLNARARVLAVAYRPDGKLLATGGEDGTIRIWNPASGDLVRMLVSDSTQSLSWSKDGKLLAAGCLSGVYLWEPDTGRMRRRLPGSTLVAWSPDGRSLVFASETGQEARLWDCATERVVHKLSFPTYLSSLAWSPDGKTVALGLQDRTARLWDASTGKETLALKHEGHVVWVAWSPNSQRLMTGAQFERTARLWDAATGKQTGAVSLPGMNAVSSALAWTPDGKAVALSFFGGPMGLFDADTGQQIRPLTDIEITNPAAVAFSPDGRQAATVGNGVRLHEVASGKLSRTLEGWDKLNTLESLVWSPDGQRLALGYHGYPAFREIVEATTGRRLSAKAEVQPLAVWAHDGKTLAAGLNNDRVGLWEGASDRPPRALDAPPGTYVFRLAWSADDKLLAGAFYHGGLWVWSSEKGKLLWKDSRDSRTGVLAWSPSRRLLATGGGDEKVAVRIWEGESGKLLHEITEQTLALAWSPDGKTLAAGAAGAGDHLLIDAASGVVRVRIPGQERWPACLRWSSDGTKLIGFDGAVRVWDAATGKQLRATESRLPHPLERVSTAAWTPDGRYLAWRMGSLEVYLGDADSRPLGVLLPLDAFGQLAITADGHFRGNSRVERLIRMVVQKRDGTSETLTPRAFEQKYGFKNEPGRVKLAVE